ncbi:MAG: hypothetical protein QM706_03325 [Nitrospira sp.]
MKKRQEGKQFINNKTEGFSQRRNDAKDKQGDEWFLVALSAGSRRVLPATTQRNNETIEQ